MGEGDGTQEQGQAGNALAAGIVAPKIRAVKGKPRFARWLALGRGARESWSMDIDCILAEYFSAICTMDPDLPGMDIIAG